MARPPLTLRRQSTDPPGSRAGGLLTRALVVGGLVIALLLVAWLVIAENDDYAVRAQFRSAGLVPEGGDVKVAGRRVGRVSDLELLPNGLAELRLEVDGDVAPLRRGTEAHLRMPSLSSSAGRYVDLRIPGDGGDELPDGSVIPVQDTQGLVDVDQFFNMFDEGAREGLRKTLRGSGAMWKDTQEFVDAGWRQLNPSFVASSRLFDELNRDSGDLRRFLTGSSRLVGALADRRDDLVRVVDRLAETTGAIAREEQSLSEAVAGAPRFMRRANSTFVNLRSTLDEVDPLVDASKPAAPRLAALLAELQPFASEARAPVRTLARTVRRPGAENDLIDLSEATPDLRDIAVRTAERNGEERRGSLPEMTAAFRGQRRQWAFWRPYGPDITAFFRAFGDVGIYDANGRASRAAALPSAFEPGPNDGVGSLIPPPQRQAAIDQRLIRQLNRCPGAAERPARDGSNPLRPTPEFNCDPTVVPPGR